VIEMKQLIPDDIFEATGMSEQEIKTEIAIHLFQLEKLTLSQASRLADLSRLQFQHLLSSREISTHYGVDDFEKDLECLKVQSEKSEGENLLS
jgi:predicted HTH domain antitoxin